MKRLLSIFLALIMVLALVACGKEEANVENPSEAGTPETEAQKPDGESTGDPYMDELLAAAKQEGELVIYGSSEEAHVSTIADAFEEKFGIPTSWQRLSGGEVQAKIEEEQGNPSADVWFGGTSDPQSVAASQGLLMKYDAHNKNNLIDPKYMDPDGYWYGVYTGIMGIFYNMEELDALGLPYPEDWDDLLDPQYKDLIWFSNPNTASTAKLFLNTTTQMWGDEKAHEYWVNFDKNVQQYTKSGSGPSKSVGIGECVIGIGFLHDAVYQISQGYDNIGIVIPKSGTSAEVGAASIFEGAKHPNAAKLFIEYALTPECVEHSESAGAYQFLVLKDVQQPKILQEFDDLSLDYTIDYDFEDAKANTDARVEAFFEVIGDNADDRFKTE